MYTSNVLFFTIYLFICKVIKQPLPCTRGVLDAEWQTQI